MDKSGNKPFVFVSYSHKDKDKVIPILNRLVLGNVAIWYDKGIEAGSEWPDYIAQKILDCDRMICFISDGYATSKNCSRELNFAISRNKPVLSIYLEDKVDMAPGMMMNLESYQSLYYSRFKSKDEFCDSLLRENFVESCRSVAQSSNTRTAEPKPAPEPEAEKEESTVIYTPPAKAKNGSLERSQRKLQAKLSDIERGLNANPTNADLAKKKEALEKKLHNVDIAIIKRDTIGPGAKFFKFAGVMILCVLFLYLLDLLMVGIPRLPFDDDGFRAAAIVSMVALGMFLLFDLFVYEFYDSWQRFIGIVNYLAMLSLSVIGNVWFSQLLAGWIDIDIHAVLFYIVAIVGFALVNLAMMFIRIFIWAIIESLVYYA